MVQSNSSSPPGQSRSPLQTRLNPTHVSLEQENWSFPQWLAGQFCSSWPSGQSVSPSQTFVCFLCHCNIGETRVSKCILPKTWRCKVRFCRSKMSRPSGWVRKCGQPHRPQCCCHSFPHQLQARSLVRHRICNNQMRKKKKKTWFFVVVACGRCKRHCPPSRGNDSWEKWTKESFLWLCGTSIQIETAILSTEPASHLVQRISWQTANRAQPSTQSCMSYYVYCRPLRRWFICMYTIRVRGRIRHRKEEDKETKQKIEGGERENNK